LAVVDRDADPMGFRLRFPSDDYEQEIRRLPPVSA
jgi:hypothetical protein